MKKILPLIFLSSLSAFGAAGDVIFKQVNPNGTAITDRAIPLPSPLVDTIYGLNAAQSKPAQYIIGSGLSLTGSYPTQTLTASGTGGTVTDFSSGNLSPLFTTSVATSTTTPALSFSLTSQTANTVFAGPTTGAAAAPTFRALVAADLPVVTVAKGGTNITSYAEGDLLYGNGGGTLSKLSVAGLPGYVLSGATTPTWVQLSTIAVASINGTANEITASASTGSVTLSLPSALTFTGKTVTGGTFNSAFNGTVGATTPSTGAFTGVTVAPAGAPGNITLGDGTSGSYSTITMRGNASQVAWQIASSNFSGSTLEFTPSTAAGGTTFTTPVVKINSTGFQGAIGATTPSTGAFTSVNVALDNTETLSVGRASTDGTVVGFRYGASFVGSISLTSTATAYNTSSDRRLKTNIRDFAGSAAIIDKIKPRIFDWKTGEKDTIGFVAQELYAVYPLAVTKGDDGEKIKQQWAVDYSKLVPVLVAEIQSLRSRVKALEGK